MEPELEGQGAINKDRTERVGVYLVKSKQVIEELNGMISTDQTGRFPTISQRGNKYIMVLYNYDSNAILATGTKGPKRYRTDRGIQNPLQTTCIGRNKTGITTAR